MKVWIGFDNGISGTIGIIKENGDYEFYPTPIKKEQSYTKKKQQISRIDVPNLMDLLMQFEGENVKVAVERPMINPERFKASMSAMRALEATIIVIEHLSFSYEYIDSKEWQKKLLPAGVTGDDLKKASKDIAQRLFPKVADKFKKDADGILIAEYLRQKNAGNGN